jgi:colicin import membrane protein
MRQPCTSLLLVWLALAGPIRAATPAPDAAERERIAGERAVVETRYAEERLACQQNFVVTSCVEDARRREREALGGLRRQEALLDEAQRRQRAAERMAAIRAKVSAEEERQRDMAANPRRVRPLQPMAPSAGPAAPARAASAPAPQTATAPAAGERESRETRSRARFEARQREAREHREAAQRRSVQRAKQGRQASTLPPPAAASAP